MFPYLPHPDWIPGILISNSDWADPWAVYIQWHSCPLSLECKFFGKGTLENLRIEHSGMCCTLSKRCFCSKLKTLLLWQVEGHFWDKDKHSGLSFPPLSPWQGGFSPFLTPQDWVTVPRISWESSWQHRYCSGTGAGQRIVLEVWAQLRVRNL